MRVVCAIAIAFFCKVLDENCMELAWAERKYAEGKLISATRMFAQSIVINFNRVDNVN